MSGFYCSKCRKWTQILFNGECNRCVGSPWWVDVLVIAAIGSLAFLVFIL